MVVHDCGRELNPLIVESMVHGSTAHGIGAALLEEFRYDAGGQLLTSTSCARCRSRPKVVWRWLDPRHGERSA